MNTPEDRLGRRVLPPRQHRLRRVVLWAAIAVILALIIAPPLITLGTDLLWFREIGFQSVFLTSFNWRGTLFAIGAVFGFGMIYLNAKIALRDIDKVPIVVVNNATGARADISKFIPRLAAGVAIVVGLIAGTRAASRWLIALQELHAQEAGVTDPVFHRDIGYYLFKLPAIESVLGGLFSLLTFTLIAAGVIYLLRGALHVPHSIRALRDAPVTAGLERRAAWHLAALLAAILLVTALDLWLVRTSSLLFSTTGPLVGASYTGVNVRLPAIRLNAIVALAGAVLVLIGAARGTFLRYAAIAGVAYVATGIIGRGIAPALMQRLVVVPNELARETDYIKRHLDATRSAWGLDSVTTRDLTGDVELTANDIRSNTATIENVRVWERDLVEQTFKQLQEIRTYYDFVSVTDDRYVIDGRYRQVHLAARELNPGSLPTRTFINEHLTFTHGMGVTMAPVNQVTSEGLPLLFIKDLPPVSTTSLTLTRPQIYYGQLTNNYVFTGAKQEEFDYPAGEANIQTRYTGRGGVPVGSFFRRLVYAWQFRSLKILLSNDITADTKLLYRRNILTRAQTALPFLGFDSEPYLVMTEGQLKWVLDAYTGSERYPYAQRTSEGLSYMRNSVKVVIDAYDGTVEAYITDPKEPIIRTVAAVFPNIFKPITEMPADLRKHVRFPGDLFRVQAQLQATYHMREPVTFYHREDQWQIPSESERDEAVNPYMRHIILRLPGEKTPEFIYMTPFTPRGKDNLAAWMVARMDGDHYGEMIVYRFPKQSLVYGPKQVSNRINQDTEISRELTLWDQRGSEVIRGELLVIPIEESLIYVQPIFLRAQGGTIPELKRVVVAHGNRVVMSETLESGLNTLFGSSASATRPIVAANTESAAPQPGATAPASMATLLSQAQQHYDRAIAAQRAGNWAEYGREIEALGAVLRQLRR